MNADFVWDYLLPLVDDVLVRRQFQRLKVYWAIQLESEKHRSVFLVNDDPPLEPHWWNFCWVGFLSTYPAVVRQAKTLPLGAREAGCVLIADSDVVSREIKIDTRHPSTDVDVMDGAPRFFKAYSNMGYYAFLLVLRADRVLISAYASVKKETWMAREMYWTAQKPFKYILKGPLPFDYEVSPKFKVVSLKDSVVVGVFRSTADLIKNPNYVAPIVAKIPFGYPLLSFRPCDAQLSLIPVLVPPVIVDVRIVSELLRYMGWSEAQFLSELTRISARWKAKDTTVHFTMTTHENAADGAPSKNFLDGSLKSSREARRLTVVSVTRSLYSTRAFAYGAIYADQAPRRSPDDILRIAVVNFPVKVMHVQYCRFLPTFSGARTFEQYMSSMVNLIGVLSGRINSGDLEIDAALINAKDVVLQPLAITILNNFGRVSEWRRHFPLFVRFASSSLVDRDRMLVHLAAAGTIPKNRKGF